MEAIENHLKTQVRLKRIADKIQMNNNDSHNHKHDKTHMSKKIKHEGAIEQMEEIIEDMDEKIEPKVWKNHFFRCKKNSKKDDRTNATQTANWFL